MAIVVKQTKLELLPTGEYLGQVMEIEAEHGQFGEQVKLKFRVLQPGFDGKLLVGWCSQKFCPKSKLYQWTKALKGGRDIPPDWDFSSDALLNCKAILRVTKETDTDGSEFNRITGLSPAPVPPRSQRPASGTPPVANASRPAPDHEWPSRDYQEAHNAGDEDLPF